jgi:8-oxo-dGTP pyrophosphatase MutT (NUDIX family)
MKLRPRAEVLCFKDGKVLVSTAQGYLCFPGGGVEPHESAVMAAKRECLVEADRVLINCTPAHPPTVQLWPEGYAKRKAWAGGSAGGFTHWMTGSTSQDPLHTSAKQRHKDYEDFEWMPVNTAVQRLKAELVGSEWADDVKVRLAILDSHLKQNSKLATPVLRCYVPLNTSN